MIVYVSIGDGDKLRFGRWSECVRHVSDAIGDQSLARHGEWLSLDAQTACWCTELNDRDVPELKVDLQRLATYYGRTITCAVVSETELLRPDGSARVAA